MNKLAVVTLLALLGCGRGPSEPPQNAEQPPPDDPYLVESDVDFKDGLPARTEDGSVNVVVEIPAGTSDKWEVEDDGTLRWEFRDGKPRVVAYLAYPANYGMVPRTLLPEELGGDGDPLDVIVLGPAVERGSVVRARILGVLELLDGGETDDKLIAVQDGTPLAQAPDLASLDELFPGVTTIIETWFANYKGVGEIETFGFSGAEEADRILDVAIEAFEAQEAARDRAA